jgi:uncharacterized protein YcbX
MATVAVAAQATCVGFLGKDGSVSLASSESHGVRIEHLYRYPVKGLTAEAIEATEVEQGGALPWDRAFALAQGDAPFDPANPAWLPKFHFMCLMKNARAAALRAAFDPRRGILTVMAPTAVTAEHVLQPAGRARMAAFLTAYLGEEARGAPQFHYIPGHVFCDQRRPVVSLLNLASLADLEAKVGVPRHWMRFRANIYFTGPPWREFEWIGRDLQVGSVRLRVVKRTVRCPATQVNPETGGRDADPMTELITHFGHKHLGVHAEVLEGGRLATGDAIELLEV